MGIWVAINRGPRILHAGKDLKMFTDQNTEGYSQSEMDALNRELTERLEGIDDPDEIDNTEKAFADEVARR